MPYDGIIRRLTYYLVPYEEMSDHGTNVLMKESRDIENTITNHLKSNAYDDCSWLQLLISSLYANDENNAISLFNGTKSYDQEVHDAIIYKKSQSDNIFYIQYKMDENKCLNKASINKNILCNYMNPGETPWKIKYNESYYIQLKMELSFDDIGVTHGL